MPDPLIFTCTAIPADWRICYVDQGAQRVYWAQQTVPPFRKTSMTTSLESAVAWANLDAPRPAGPEQARPEADQLPLF